MLSKDDNLQALQRGKLVEMGEKSRNSITTGIRGFTYLYTETVFLNFQGAQGSIPRNQFRKPLSVLLFFGTTIVVIYGSSFCW
jgi:hypothetical protein